MAPDSMHGTCRVKGIEYKDDTQADIEYKMRLKDTLGTRTSIKSTLGIRAKLERSDTRMRLKGRKYKEQR